MRRKNSKITPRVHKWFALRWRECDCCGDEIRFERMWNVYTHITNRWYCRKCVSTKEEAITHEAVVEDLKQYINGRSGASPNACVSTFS